MDELLTRIWENLTGRIGGAMSFRLILQPAVAIFFALRDGLKDARANRPPYFWTIFSDSSQRRDLLHEGWKAVIKVFIMAVLIDAVYQYLQLAWFYPGEALIVAFALAFVPYLLIRGPVNRVARALKILPKERRLK
jgi:hypothetical protein